LHLFTTTIRSGSFLHSAIFSQFVLVCTNVSYDFNAFNISSIKQAVESLNNWLIEKTNIQKASKVRSASGLIAFIFARIASACFILNS